MIKSRNCETVIYNDDKMCTVIYNDAKIFKGIYFKATYVNLHKTGTQAPGQKMTIKVSLKKSYFKTMARNYFIIQKLGS